MGNKSSRQDVREELSQTRPELLQTRPDDPFVRAQNEDDDGYDPYSDRPAPAEPLFEADPWA